MTTGSMLGDLFVLALYLTVFLGVLVGGAVILEAIFGPER